MVQSQQVLTCLKYGRRDNMTHSSFCSKKSVFTDMAACQHEDLDQSFAPTLDNQRYATPRSITDPHDRQRPRDGPCLAQAEYEGHDVPDSWGLYHNSRDCSKCQFYQDKMIIDAATKTKQKMKIPQHEESHEPRTKPFIHRKQWHCTIM